MNKTRILAGVAMMLALVTAIGLVTNSGIVKSASAVYYGACYYCKWNGSGYDCTCYDGAGGAFCTNPCSLHFTCLPAN
jgi:hypothetical protein